MMFQCTIDGCDGVSHAKGFCGRHYQRYQKHRDPSVLIGFGRNPRPVIDGKLRCGRCHEWKPIALFYGDESTTTKKHSWCRSCATIAARIYRNKNREAVRAREKQRVPVYRERRRQLEVKRKYGLTAEEFRDLVARHDGRCAGCGVSFDLLPWGKGKGWCVDHDHKTGHVRGVLCHGCNKTIGLLHDDSNRLRALANYLDRACTAVEAKVAKV